MDTSDRARRVEQNWKIGRGANWPNSDKWVMLPSPQDHGSTIGLGLDQWKFRIIKVASVEGRTVIAGKRKQCLFKIIAKDLRFSQKDEIWLVHVNIEFQIKEISCKAFDVPGKSKEGRRHSSRCYARGFSASK